MRPELKTTLERLGAIPAKAWTIIVGLFVTGIGNYMVIPFFALYCTKELGFTAAQVGALLTVRLWSQRGCALFGGMLADRFTPRRIMVIGLVLRCVGFLGIASSSTFWQLLICTAITGSGAALYMPAGKAALVSLSTADNRLLMLSLRNTAYNVGAAVGPVIGLLGSYLSYRLTLVGGGGLFVITAVAIALLVPRSLTGPAARTVSIKDMRRLMGDVRVLTLCLAMLVFFGFYVQLELTLPIFADRAFSRSAVSMLFMANAVTTILLQVPLSSWIDRMSTSSAIALGFTCTGVGFLLISAPLGLPSFLAGIIAFSLSEILVEPKVDNEIGRIVPASLLGTGFGLASLACSIGGALGHEAGAVGLPMAEALGGQSLFFLVLGMIGIVSAYAISLSIRRITTAKEAT